MGWLTDVVANLLVAYLLFVGADAAAALNALSDRNAVISNAEE